MPRLKSELYSKLSSSCSEDGLHEGSEYIPADAVKNIIIRDSIKAELARSSGNGISLSGCLADKVVKKNAKKIFAILVYLKEPWDIKKMLNDGFADDDLPLSKDGPYGLRSARDPKKIFVSEDWEPQTVDDFLLKQWMVLAPIFTIWGEHFVVNRKCLLPFSEVDGVKHSESSVVYKAKVHPSQQEGFEAEAPNLLVALKEFNFTKEKDFKQERENLEKIRGLEKNEHIAQSLATFSHGSSKHYIIFPWAEGGDLSDFWERKDAEMRTPQLALWCLRQMLGLAEALQALHQEIDPKANCRHGDLKPGNILHFLTEREDILKITDFGISRIHNDATYERMGKPTITRATTRSYEAPEAAPLLSQLRARSRKYDIWSLGCIFLEFTIWLVHSLDDVRSFNDSRKSEPTGEGSEAHFYQITDSTPEVHPKVLQRISDLKMVAKSKEGTALGDLLDLIKTSLLEVEVDIRLDAAQLCSHLGTIVQKAKTDPIYLFNNETSAAVT